MAGPSALRSELEAARARLLKLEESLAQASARRETAANDLVTVWKQLMASREELEQLRRQRDDNAQLASRTREVEMMLKTQGDELAAGRLRIETLRAEVDRLQAQNAEGERRHVDDDGLLLAVSCGKRILDVGAERREDEGLDGGTHCHNLFR